MPPSLGKAFSKACQRTRASSRTCPQRVSTCSTTARPQELETDGVARQEVHEPGQRQADADEGGRVIEDAALRALPLRRGLQEPQDQGDAQSHDDEVDHMAAEKAHLYRVSGTRW